MVQSVLTSGKKPAPCGRIRVFRTKVPQPPDVENRRCRWTRRVAQRRREALYASSPFLVSGTKSDSRHAPCRLIPLWRPESVASISDVYLRRAPMDSPHLRCIELMKRLDLIEGSRFKCSRSISHGFLCRLPG